MNMLILGSLLFLMLPGCAHIPPAINLEQSLGRQKTFDYQGIKINYYEAGQGTPVILLHGFGGFSYSWRFLAPALIQDYRVFTIDLKGFGLSDKPRDGKYAVSDQADMVAAFMRQNNLHDAVIIGHSMGGGVTLNTYFKVREDQPSRIKSLVLIDSPGYPQKMPWFIQFAKLPVLSSVGNKLLPPRLATRLVLKGDYYDKDKITEEQINTYAYYDSLPGAWEAVVQSAKQIVPQDLEALASQYKTITVPVLIIWGEDDQVIPLSVGLKFKRDIPDAKLVILPRCGHIPLEEKPKAATRVIQAFLYQ